MIDFSESKHRFFSSDFLGARPSVQGFSAPHSAVRCIADLGNNSPFDDSNECETQVHLLTLLLFYLVASRQNTVLAPFKGQTAIYSPKQFQTGTFLVSSVFNAIWLSFCFLSLLSPEGH